MLGQAAEVLDWSGEEGHVLAVGERWQARHRSLWHRASVFEITGVEGLVLEVRRRLDLATNSGE